MEERFAGQARAVLDRSPDCGMAYPSGQKNFARLEPGETVSCAAAARMR
jgi:hypothetical protein